MKTKLSFKKITSCFLTVSMALSLITCVKPSTVAFAKTDTSANASDFTVNIVKNGQTTLIHKYTIDDMKALQTSEPVYYTSIDSMPAPVGTKAQGVPLRTLLNNANIKNYSAIKLFTTDTPNGYTTIQKSYLEGSQRYYYPNLFSNWAIDDDGNAKPGSGASVGGVAVEPMFAVTSYQGRNLTKSDLDNQTMDDTDMFRLCFGQTQDDITKGTITTNKFAKWVNRIDIYLPNAPTLTAASTNNTVGKPMDLTFTDDAAWRSAITGITVNGNAIDKNKYTLAQGKITIDSSVFTAAGDYSIAVQATDYNDATVTQTINSSGTTVATPTINADIDNNIDGQPIDLTFTDDAAWRNAITGITVNGSTIDKSKYTIAAAKITIDGSVFTAASSSVFTAAGDYSIAVQATDYNDATVTQTINEAPKVNADAIGNTPYKPIELAVNMSNPQKWTGAITGITIDGNAIDSSKYAISTGKITIDGNVFTTAGDYKIAVQAKGYNDVTVTQTINAPVAATEFTVNIVKNGQTTLVHKYTIDEMKVLQTTTPAYYTSIDSVFGLQAPVNTKAPVSTKAQGVLVSKLIEDAQKYNSDVSSYASLKIYTTGSTNFFSMPSKASLYDANNPRYYYPNLISTWDAANNKPGTGATDGAVAVEPMFAITSCQGRNLTQSDLDKQTMDGNNTFRFCMGQRLSDITNANVTTTQFAECANRIDIYLPYAPTLTAATTNNTVGKSIDLTFTSSSTNTGWKDAITGITVNGNSIDKSKYATAEGKITIDSSVFTAAGDYAIVVQANGYNDGKVTQKIQAGQDQAQTLIKIGGACVATPVTVNCNDFKQIQEKISTIDDYGNYKLYAIQGIKLSDILSKVTLKGTPSEYKFIGSDGAYRCVAKQDIDATRYYYPSVSPEDGKVAVDPIIALTYNSSGDYTQMTNGGCPRNFYGQVDPKENTVGHFVKGLVEIDVLAAAPALTAAATNNTVGKSIDLTFTDDEAWRNAVTGITVNGSTIDKSKYTITAGKITIDSSIFTSVGDYKVTVQATGYSDSTVTQSMQAGQDQAQILIKIGGACVATPVTINCNDFKQVQEKISTISDNGDYKVYAAQGVKLSDILSKVTLKGTPYAYKFIGSDGAYRCVTKQDMDAARYYYPSVSPQDGKVAVDPIIALTYNSNGDYTQMTNGGCPRNFYGQVDPKENSVGNFVKGLVEIDILAAPATLTAAATNNTVGKSIDLTFTDDEAWRNAVTGITVNGSTIDKSKYTIETGKITIDSSIFTAVGDYKVTVQATGYSDSTVTQTIVNETVKNGLYTITPAKDDAYQIGTDSGISTFTVKNGISGFRYFTANITPVKAHDGTETVVFAKYSNGVLMNMNATVADFDTVSSAQAGFNVKEGDVVKVYIVDKLTNDTSINPIVLQ